MFDRLQKYIRERFTRTILITEEYPPSALTLRRARTVQKTLRAPKRRAITREIKVPPSKRFVWGMIVLIIALIGLITLQAIHVIVTGHMNNELTSILSGLIGSFVTAFLLGKG